MKKLILLSFLLFGVFCNSQSLIQSVNSGSVIATNSSVSIGEIIVIPTQNQSNSGLIGILAQVNQQLLEVAQFEISEDVVVYPNPTASKIFFKTNQILVNKKVSIFNNLGQLIIEKQIDTENAIDLTDLSVGVYLIQFENKTLKSFKIIKK